jgi:hypothetical protein
LSASHPNNLTPGERPHSIGQQVTESYHSVLKLNSDDEQWLYEAKFRRDTDVFMNYSYVVLVTAEKGGGEEMRVE